MCFSTLSIETHLHHLSVITCIVNFRESSRHETYRLNVQQNVDELKKEKVQCVHDPPLLVQCVIHHYWYSV